MAYFTSPTERNPFAQANLLIQSLTLESSAAHLVHVAWFASAARDAIKDRINGLDSRANDYPRIVLRVVALMQSGISDSDLGT